ncbi:MAG: hypothetical protein EBS21_10760 [Sphingomonadaceae bacterium]|nr:hypothetical protein [Sphingomonadaceae bacterium]
MGKPGEGWNFPRRVILPWCGGTKSTVAIGSGFTFEFCEFLTVGFIVAAQSNMFVDLMRSALIVHAIKLQPVAFGDVVRFDFH